MFFDRFPRFYETSETGASRGRLNLRYEAIFAENRDVFAGAKVIDIASHDGRWSLAALRTGAAEVVGIEARDDLVRAAEENLHRYAGGDGRCRFVSGDIFDVLGREAHDADVVLCLGYLYHTLRYNELLSRIKDVNPRYLIVDTSIVRSKRPVVRLRLESNDPQRNAVADSLTHGDRTLIGWPSRRALELIVEGYGFRVERYSDWGSLLRDNSGLDGLEDYAEGRRVTARCIAVD
ncbi:MAG TPA: class I SAM-dependent methyltransferase [Gaiellaceae bacterium]|jgi:hypothetical protein|nr:class I SAM-dependent methyltransferase [Gaiellaceae bacterium]